MCLVASGRKLFMIKHFSPVFWQLGHQAVRSSITSAWKEFFMTTTSSGVFPSGKPVHLALQLSRSDTPSSFATPPPTNTVQDGKEAPFSNDPNGELSRWTYTGGRRPSSSANPQVGSKKPSAGPVWPT